MNSLGHRGQFATSMMIITFQFRLYIRVILLFLKTDEHLGDDYVLH